MTVTCSFGLASTENTAPARLVREADEALYRAKAQGRDCVAAREGSLLTVNYSLTN
jgi:GGDEF domain-containing protein